MVFDLQVDLLSDCDNSKLFFVVHLANLIQNLGSCRNEIEALAEQSKGEFEQSILAEAMNDVRSALMSLERLIVHSDCGVFGGSSLTDKTILRPFGG